MRFALSTMFSFLFSIISYRYTNTPNKFGEKDDADVGFHITKIIKINLTTQLTNVKILLVLYMKNPFEYLKSIQAKWAWQSYCVDTWHKIPIYGSNKNKFVLSVLLSTGGLSDHEQIIENIDKLFWDVCWQFSKRGGHYKFTIDPTQWGYKLVNDYARDKGVSRQSIYNYPDKFEWIHVSKGVKFIKPI